MKEEKRIQNRSLPCYIFSLNLNKQILWCWAKRAAVSSWKFITGNSVIEMSKKKRLNKNAE